MLNQTAFNKILWTNPKYTNKSNLMQIETKI